MFETLQYISQGATAAEQLDNITLALDGGCRWIQLRFKNASLGTIAPLGVQVKARCVAYAATLIINDHPCVARDVDADGVHLGLSDMSVEAAKKILGPGKIIGGTANTLEDVVQRVEERCHYVGLGPLRFTQTKEKLSPVLGIDGYRRILSELHQLGMSIPIYAIGGIIPSDLPHLREAGVYGVAVSGIITHYPDKEKIIKQLCLH